jgi:hypothetical protein
MRVVVSVLLLCVGFLLAKGGNTPIDTGIQYATAQPIEKTAQVKFADINPDFAVIKDTGSNEEDQYLISDDIAEEEANNLSVRKYKLLATPCLTSFYTYSASNLHQSCKDRLFFCRPLSYKYILQSVLRI